MLGYMNREAVEATTKTGFVHFYSRSKQRLWKKGESSQNVLVFKSMVADCDSDALLVQAAPAGPTCHTGSESCFAGAEDAPLSFLCDLTKLIEARKSGADQKSYVAALFKDGTKKIAQKVVEEAGEVAIEAVANDRALFAEEASDLLFHLMVLLSERGTSLGEVARLLAARHATRTK